MSKAKALRSCQRYGASTRTRTRRHSPFCGTPQTRHGSQYTRCRYLYVSNSSHRFAFDLFLPCSDLRAVPTLIWCCFQWTHPFGRFYKRDECIRPRRLARTSWKPSYSLNRLTSGGLPSSLNDTLVIVRRAGTCVRLDGEQRLLHPILNQPNALRLLDLFPTVNHAWIFVLGMLLHSMDD